MLVGFRERDPAELVVVKKIVGSYARKLADMKGDGFRKLTVTMKPVHKQEGSEKFEIHVKAELDGKTETVILTDHNLFVVLDAALKKLLSAVSLK